MVNPKISNTLHFLFLNKILAIKAGIHKNCPWKRIVKNRGMSEGMSCNSLWISMFMVLIRGQKVLSFRQIYFLRNIGAPESDRN